MRHANRLFPTVAASVAPLSGGRWVDFNTISSWIMLVRLMVWSRYRVGVCLTNLRLLVIVMVVLTLLTEGGQARGLKRLICRVGSIRKVVVVGVILLRLLSLTWLMSSWVIELGNNLTMLIVTEKKVGMILRSMCPRHL